MENHGDSVAPSNNPKIDMTVESQVSKSARPGAPPVFPLSTFEDNSRYTRSEDVGHPPQGSLCKTQISAPVLRTVIDMQDFDSFSFHGIDHDVRERRKRQFFGAAPVAGPAS